MLLNIIFSWLVIMIALNIYRGKKAKEGGRRMGEHFNGRCKW